MWLIKSWLPSLILSCRPNNFWKFVKFPIGSILWKILWKKVQSGATWLHSINKWTIVSFEALQNEQAGLSLIFDFTSLSFVNNKNGLWISENCVILIQLLSKKVDNIYFPNHHQLGFFQNISEFWVLMWVWQWFS